MQEKKKGKELKKYFKKYQNANIFIFYNINN